MFLIELSQIIENADALVTRSDPYFYRLMAPTIRLLFHAARHDEQMFSPGSVNSKVELTADGRAFFKHDCFVCHSGE